MSRLAAGFVLAVCAAAGCSETGDAQAPPQPVPSGIIREDWVAAAVADFNRPPADRVRDVDRKPGEVLKFFGIEPGMRVADLMCGTGYYTELLSKTVGSRGMVFAHNSPFVLQRFAEGPLSERLSRPGFDNVTRINAEPESPQLPDGLDAAVLIRFYHDFYWQGVDRAAFNRAVFEALKPGGIFGVVDHHAEAGSGDRDVQTLHRVDMALVQQEIESAGFVLDGASEILSHPEDTRDWNIFEDSAARRDKTDRFVLRFRRPA